MKKLTRPNTMGLRTMLSDDEGEYKKYGFPVTPMCIALVLGSLFETALRRALILSKGNVMVFFTRPVSCAIIVLAFLALLYPIIGNILIANRQKQKTEH